MKRLWGITLLIILAALAGGEPTLAAPQAPAVSADAQKQRLSKDLGERGQIIIESLDLNEADLSDVVRLLARISGINIITGDLRGSITVYLENVTVQSALQAILASQGYGFLVDGNIVRIVDASKLGEDRVETITESFILNYLPALPLAQSLKKVFSGSGSGSSVSQIEANEEANAVIVVDIPKRVEEIRKMIAALDRRFEQVEIEGRFVEIAYNNESQWGIDWKYFQDPANTLDINLAPSTLNNPAMPGQFKFAIINGSDNLSGFIQALEKDNDLRVLADPKILALENKEAIIELTNELPFVEANVSQGVVTESIQYTQTGITLRVTPQIAEEDDGTYVRMKLELVQRIPGEVTILQNSTAVPVDSRRANSELIVPDDSTVIIGGLRSNDLTYTYQKVPFLGNIPFIGNAFKKRDKKDRQKELLLFVTPRVIYDHPPLDCHEQDLHDKIEKVADSLETQSEWIEKVEAPIDMTQKKIKYSGVDNNEEGYDRILREKERIENVKPYKVHKPKGVRRYKIKGENGQVKETEVMAPIEEDGEVGSATGEVKDFSAMEKMVRPGTGRPAEEYMPAEQQQEGMMPEAMPLIPMQIGPDGKLVPMAPPPDQEPMPAEQEQRNPEWLRTFDKPSSDAGDLKDGEEVARSREIDQIPLNEAVDLPSPNPNVSIVNEIPFKPIQKELDSPEASLEALPEISLEKATVDANDPWMIGMKREAQVSSPAAPTLASPPASPPASAPEYVQSGMPSLQESTFDATQEKQSAGLLLPGKPAPGEDPAPSGFQPMPAMTQPQGADMPIVSPAAAEKVTAPDITASQAPVVPSVESSAALTEADRLIKLLESRSPVSAPAAPTKESSKIVALNNSETLPASSATNPPARVDKNPWWKTLDSSR